MSHEDYQGLGTSVIQRELERAGTVQPGEEKTERSNQCVKIPDAVFQTHQPWVSVI